MTLDEGNDIGMRPAFGDWLRDRSMAELMSTIIETLNEVQRRGHEPTVVWTGKQWAVMTEDQPSNNQGDSSGQAQVNS